MEEQPLATLLESEGGARTPASAPASGTISDFDALGNADGCADSSTDDVLKFLTEDEIENAFRELEAGRR